VSSKITLPTSEGGVQDDDNDVLNHLLEQLEQKARRNGLRTAYYESRKFARRVGTTIPAQYQNLALVLGWPAKAVDALARRCNLDGFTWAGGNLADLGMSDLVADNALLSEVAQARIDSLLHGVSFLITTSGDESEGEPSALITAKDALNATGDWNVRRRRLDNLLSITSRDSRNNPDGLALYLDGRTITADRDGGKWAVDVQEHSWGVPVDPLVYRPRLSRRLGSSRITRPVMSITDQALRTLPRLEAHMDIYAIAKLILLGADGSIFKNADGSPKEAWQIVMGRVFGVPDNEDADPENARADVKQFTAESPEPHLAHLNALAKLFARETSLPDTAVAITDISNPTSAESYDASQYELIAEAEGATDDWSTPTDRAVQRALAIRNGLSEVPPEYRTIEGKWRDPRYLSRSQEADAGGKQIAAVPWLAETEVGLELLGLSEPQIKRALAEKRRAAGRQVLAALNRRVPADDAVAE
jgi:hypothetical protein